MDSKKIVLVTALAFLAIISIASVSAWDLFGTSSESTTTVGGYEFNIPDGYEKNESYECINETTTEGPATFYVNAEGFQKGDDEVIYIHVADYSVPGYETNLTTDHLKQSGLGDSKIINGIEGLIAKNEFDDLNVTAFFYAKGGDLITVMSTDESLLEQIIPEE